MAIYAGDSFFTLEPWAQVGLAGLSAVLGAGVLFAVARLVSAWNGGGWVASLALGAGLWWGFLWLSPQVYYLYYQAVIPGLPWQVVIGWPPGPGEILSLMTFTERPSLSAHARGLLGWGCLAVAAIVRIRRRRSRRSR